MTMFCSLPQHSIQPNVTTAAVTAQTQSDDVGLNKKSEVRDNCGTQTEIIAVHTPQVDNPPFPFNNKLMRPSTLPLTESNETSPLLLSNDQLQTNNGTMELHIEDIVEGGEKNDRLNLVKTPSSTDKDTFCVLDNENKKDVVICNSKAD